MYSQFTTDNQDIERLIAAAIVNRDFRTLLLKDPALAIANGFNGETFDLPPREKALILSINASSLVEFARQLQTSQPSANSGTSREHQAFSQRLATVMSPTR